MKKILIYISAIVLLTGCEINQKDSKPEDSFIKIFNNPSQSLAYYPMGVVQTSDGGYLMVCGLKNDTSLYEYPTAMLIKSNASGEMEWTQETEWLAPANGIISLNNEYLFAAMDRQYNGYLIKVDAASGSITAVEIGVTMPLAAFSSSSNQVVVLSYDYIANASVVSIYNSSLLKLNSTSLNVIDLKGNADIQAHMNKTGTELPLFIGEWNSGAETGFFVNCLANYTLRTVFFDNNVNRTGGDIYSFQTRDAISSLTHKEGTTFALTRYYGGHNYIAPVMDVNLNGSQNFNDFSQDQLHELVPNAKVVARNVTFGETKYILFAATTNSNSVVIYQYGLTDEEPIHSHYIEFSDRIEVYDVIQDSNDEGIVVLGKLFFTGKYMRPVLIKVKKNKFKI